MLFLRLINATKIYGLRSVNNKYKFNENEITLYDKLFYTTEEIIENLGLKKGFDKIHIPNSCLEKNREYLEKNKIKVIFNTEGNSRAIERKKIIEILDYLKIKSKKDVIRLPKGIEKKYLEIIPKIIFNTEGSTRKIEENKLKEILDLLDGVGQEIWMISTPNRRKEIEKILSIKKYKNIKKLPPTNFYEAIEFIRKCELLISPNTALIHVAGVYNKKIIGLYSNLKWHTELWKPIVDEYELIIPKKETTNTDDLGEIDAQKVKEAFLRLLKLED